MITWKIEDHLCKSCGGRILKSVSGAGMTPGGNPIFMCADCGVSAYGFDPSKICWCGLTHKGQRFASYMCANYSVIEKRPGLADAFRSCGSDPDRHGNVGIMLVEQWRDLEKYPEVKE